MSRQPDPGSGYGSYRPLWRGKIHRQPGCGERKRRPSRSRLLAGKTVLVIAHRMRTVAGADQIVVLEEGRVAQKGTPQELMEQGGLYRHMVELQSETAEWRFRKAP